MDLSEVAIGVMGELWPLASAKDIDLGSVAHEHTLVQGDPDALRMLVTNIVDNAIRYTPQGGRVDINLHRHAETVELEVIDTGNGIPQRTGTGSSIASTGASATARAGADSVWPS